jgi:hypothetical protein
MIDTIKSDAAPVSLFTPENRYGAPETPSHCFAHPECNLSRDTVRSRQLYDKLYARQGER